MTQKKENPTGQGEISQCACGGRCKLNILENIATKRPKNLLKMSDQTKGYLEGFRNVLALSDDDLMTKRAVNACDFLLKNY